NDNGQPFIGVWGVAKIVGRYLSHAGEKSFLMRGCADDDGVSSPQALGKKQRHCIHVQNNEDCGCATGNLLATISRARRTIPAVVRRRRTALLGGASSHVGAESVASSSNLQWNEPVTFERCV